ncbi:MAG: dicarboxylate/amino acid:cation symporter [Pelagibacterales bacterium]|nr:dicarboxylate/amino acid:cation symporter [Pelagibacterales bacterium]|tara:strand:- start:15070 stop:16293 length:1224 start_codon:yes stop_codon:yes gene_type:complete
MDLSKKIFLALGIGFFLGSLFNYLGVMQEKFFIDFIEIPGSLFISSLKMLIVPVVFFSIVSGVSNLSNVSTLGRIGTISVILYLITTCIAITLALIFSNIIDPGIKKNITGLETVLKQEAPALKDVIINIVPSNIFKAFTEANMLQVIFFALIFGITLNLIKKNNVKLKDGILLLNDLFLKMIEVIMHIAPYGVFFLIFKTFLTQGFETIFELGEYFFTVLLVLIIHLIFTYGGLLLILGKINIFKFFSKMKNSMLFAFSTSSSAATIPVNLKTVEENLGVKKSVASFTVPLGATINMDGTAIMQGVATVFIANTYGIDLSVADFMSVILVATLASIGTAGVPGVGLIMLTMVLNQVGLPVEGIALIIGIDRILDMTRTAVNVTGDATISCIVAKIEKKLDLKKINS